MPNTNVHITVRSVQHFEGLEPERLEQQADACLEKTPAGWTLTYEEGEEFGLGSTRTILEIGENSITLTRAGETRSQMVFQTGQAHTSLYETPYGKLPMTIRTLSLKADLTGEGGGIRIHYQIQLGNSPGGETRLELTVRKKENRYDR